MTADAQLDALNPSQRDILRLAAEDNPIIVWSGAIRSGKGVGTAHWIIGEAVKQRHELGAPPNFILAGSTSGSFLANNLGYLIDIAAQFGLSARYTTGDGQPRVELSLGTLLLANLRVYGGGNARSHFSLRGLTAHSAWIDEATLVHEDFVRTAIQRCSYADSRVVLTTNAGVPTHWLKRDLIDTGAAALLETDFRENVHYSDERRQVMLALNPHTADYKRAIGNLWTADEGAIIPILPQHMDDDAYDPSTLLTGDVYMDPGTAGTTAALLFVPTKYGHLVADEYYHEGQRAGRLTDDEHIRRIQAKWQIRRLTIDPAAASMRAMASRMGYMPRLAHNDFEPGVQSANNALYAGKVKIRPTCRNLIAESGAYIWNPAERAPVATAPDHLMDCLRYGVYDLHPSAFSMVF